jgi:hypothetical protein
MDSSMLPWAFVVGMVGLGYAGLQYKNSKYPMCLVKSSVDGEEYLVRNLPDKQDAANRLARVREKLLKLRAYVDVKFPDKPFVRQMMKNFDCSAARFSESSPDAQYTSYSVNKGEKVFMCLRQRNSKEELVQENIILFVAIHEMSHVGTSSIGHTPEFWNHFAWLLQQAEAINIYQYMDFAAHPVEYCGVHITDSPKYKESINDEVNAK